MKKIIIIVFFYPMWKFEIQRFRTDHKEYDGFNIKYSSSMGTTCKAVNNTNSLIVH